MDALKAAFESQFGTEWSAPVLDAGTRDDGGESGSGGGSGDEAAAHSGAGAARSSDSESEAETADVPPRSRSEGPIVVKHDDSKLGAAPPIVSRAQRRRFMSSGAPRDDTQLPAHAGPASAEDADDLKNDLALQRIIEESHILNDRTQGQAFSGADISGAVDPLEHVGKTRLKIMEARLAKAGAKQSTQRMPQAMAVGIRDKRVERKQRAREEARDAGIVVAKDRHTRSKNRTRDRGLKINTVGRASEHGIHVSQADIARVSGQGRVAKGRRKR